MCVPGKAVVSMPVGGPAMMNNYMIAQPPGFQLATFVSANISVCIFDDVLCALCRNNSNNKSIVIISALFLELRKLTINLIVSD